MIVATPSPGFLSSLRPSSWTPAAIGISVKHWVEAKTPSLSASVAVNDYFNDLTDRSPSLIATTSAGTLTSRPQLKSFGVELDAGYFGMAPAVSFAGGVAFTAYGVMQVDTGGGAAYLYAHSTLAACLFELSGTTMYLSQDNGANTTVASAMSTPGTYQWRLRRQADGTLLWRVTGAAEATAGGTLAGAFTFDSIGGLLGTPSEAAWGMRANLLVTGDTVADGTDPAIVAYLSRGFGTSW